MEKSPQELCQILVNQVSALNKAKLLQTCQPLELPGFEGLTEETGVSVKAFIKKIHRHLLREELEEQDDEGKAVYVKLQEFLKGLIVEPPNNQKHQ